VGLVVAKVACGQIFPLPIKSKYFLQHPDFENSQPMFFPSVQETKFQIDAIKKAKLQLKCKGNLSEDVFNANNADVQTFRKK
jgi:hypothetical protein